MKITEEKIVNNFFKDLLGFDPDIDINQSEGQININLKLEPEQSGAVIGYRGEVLAAIQLVLGLIIENHKSLWVPIRLNVNDYRQQRLAALESLALNSAQRAVQSDQVVTLGNLSSYERRVVHTFLSNNPNVKTHSQGSDPYRVLIITPKP